MHQIRPGGNRHAPALALLISTEAFGVRAQIVADVERLNRRQTIRGDAQLFVPPQRRWMADLIPPT